MREKLIDRIQKLLRLSENNSSIEEAALAAATAQRLMAEHKISMSEVGDLEDDEPIIKFDLLESEGRKIPFKWRRWVLAAVAKTHFCRCIYRSSQFTFSGVGSTKKGCLWLAGKQSDVEAARYVYQFLTNEIDRLCTNGANKQFGGAGGDGRRRWMNSFRMGAANEISTIMNKKYRDFIGGLADQKSSTALVRATGIVDDWVKTNFGRLSSRADNLSNFDNTGFLAGKTAAHSIDLSDKQKLSPASPRLNR